MSFWTLIAAAGTFASILGLFHTYASRRNGKETRQILAQNHKETLQVLEGMDIRADERHKEMVELIRTIAR